MDTSELRRAFTGSKSVTEHITNFHHDRVDAIREGKTHVKLLDEPKVICHLIPLESFTSGVDHVMSAMDNQLVNLPLLYSSGGWSPLYTEDGLIVCDGPYRPPSSVYVQLFRTGVIESVSACDVTYMFQDDPQKNLFLSTYYQQQIIVRLPKYCEALRNLGTQPPVLLLLTLTGMQGVRIRVEHLVGVPFNRDVILLPPVKLPDLEIDDFAPVLRSTFDLLWNIAGYPRCFDYKEDGSFKYRH